MSQERRKFNKKSITTVIFVILVIALLAAIGYITLDKINTGQQEQLQAAFQQGAGQGLQQTIVSLFQQTDNCQVATLNFGENQRQVIDIACLQQRAP